MGRTPNEFERLAEGKGHRFTVHQVASAGMKDGSVTLPLGSVDVQPKTRMRFFVRESDCAKKNVKRHFKWVTRNKRSQKGLDRAAGEKTFNPSVCILLPTLDRGSNFFSGKPRGMQVEQWPNIFPRFPALQEISPMVCLDTSMTDVGGNDVSIFGTSSSYFLIGTSSKLSPPFCNLICYCARVNSHYIPPAVESRRPIFSPSRAAANEEEAIPSRRKREEAATDSITFGAQ
jgi:hypothetical protein